LAFCCCLMNDKKAFRSEGNVFGDNADAYKYEGR
jgi:hypothetical protein